MWKRLLEDVKIKDKIVLIGRNGVGKTYAINQMFEKHTSDNIVFIMNSDISTSFEFDSNNRSSIANQLINLINKQYSGDLEKHIGNILNNTSSKVNRINREVKQSFYSDFNVELQISRKDIDSGAMLESIPVASDGTGHKMYYILNLVCELLKLHLAENPGKNVILLVDEPEKYSHPSLTIKTAKRLRELASSNFKILVSTHSPIFTKYFVTDISEVYLLKNRDELVVNDIDDLSDDIYNLYSTDVKSRFESMKKLVQSKRTISNYINKVILSRIVESLFTDLVVISEGFAEQVLLDYIVLNSNLTFDFSVLTCSGKGLFPMYMTIMEKYHIPYFSLFDSDSSNPRVDVHKEYNNFIMDKSSGYYTFPEDIEDYFEIEYKKGKQTYSTSEIARKLMNKNMQSNKEEIDRLLKDLESGFKTTLSYDASDFSDVLTLEEEVAEGIKKLRNEIQLKKKSTDFSYKYKELRKKIYLYYDNTNDGMVKTDNNLKTINDYYLNIELGNNRNDYFKGLSIQEKKFGTLDTPYLIFDRLIRQVDKKEMANHIFDTFIFTKFKRILVMNFLNNELFEDYEEYYLKSRQVEENRMISEYNISNEVINYIIDEYSFSAKIDYDYIKKHIDFITDESKGFREKKANRDAFMIDINRFLLTYY